MKLTMLGTGHATATRYYNTCFTLSNDNEYFLIDGGGGNGILKILEEEEIPLSKIHDVFVTHGHTDHVLGIVWIIRMIGQLICRGDYMGTLKIYCHEELMSTLTIICKLTLMAKITKQFGKRIQFISLRDGDEHLILGCKVKFFDICSMKLKQFGFYMVSPNGTSIVCCGDEPYNEKISVNIKGCDWLLHEAFCLYEEKDKFEPYEKSHSTVKDACELAERLNIRNLVLYHTEDSHIDDKKRLYYNEGSQYFSGNLYIPNDCEILYIL